MVSLNKFCGSTKDKKRYGRGGCFGGTSGRGHKGYKARSGSTVKGFEGGQTPIYRRLPMRGFNGKSNKNYVVVSLKKILPLLDKSGVEINNTVLFEKNIIKNIDLNIKIIGSDVDEKLLNNIKTVDVYCVSGSLQEKLKSNGVNVCVK